MILITGATGNLGSDVIEHLLKIIKPGQIIALVRDLKKAEKWSRRGITVRLGNYDDKKSVEEAFVGVTKVLLIPGSDKGLLMQHQQVINIAKAAGIKHFYYTSGAVNRDIKKSKLGTLNEAYKPTEDYLKKSGLTYTIFQNGLYLETIPFFIGDRLPAFGIRFPSGDGRASFAKRAEMGEAIAKVIAGHGHENKSYILTANETYSFRDIADILTRLSAIEISFKSPDIKSFEAELRKYEVDEQDIRFASLFAMVVANNEYEIADPTLENLLGRRPLELKQYLDQYYLKKK